ncbi:MAG: family 4 glycosyl hydrolase [Candidatus Asgardarchaeia archaeon]
MLRVCIIGGGSGYAPLIVDGIKRMGERFPVDELVLMDINSERLEIIGNFCRKFAKNLGLENMNIVKTTDAEDAIAGSDFILTMIRPGGIKGRALDERVALEHDVLPHETMGAAGLSFSMRVVPIMVEYAKIVENKAPNAWIINFTNPTSIVTEAVNMYTKAKIVGICDAPFEMIGLMGYLLGLRGNIIEINKRLFIETIGPNHAWFARRVFMDGEDVTERVMELFKKAADFLFKYHETIYQDVEIMEAYRMIPHPYLAFTYFFQEDYINIMKKHNRTRGEALLEITSRIMEEYKKSDGSRLPPSLMSRGRATDVSGKTVELKFEDKSMLEALSGGYALAALSIASLIHKRERGVVYGNMPNSGALDGIGRDVVMEMPLLVDGRNLRPVRLGQIPDEIHGFILSQKMSERFIVRGVMEKSYEFILKAFLCNPYIKARNKIKVCKSLVEKYLELNKKWIGEFKTN